MVLRYIPEPDFESSMLEAKTKKRKYKFPNPVGKFIYPNDDDDDDNEFQT